MQVNLLPAGINIDIVLISYGDVYIDTGLISWKETLRKDILTRARLFKKSHNIVGLSIDWSVSIPL